LFVTRILLATPEYPPYGSGIAHAVYQLQDRIIKKGVGVDVLCPGDVRIKASNLLLKISGLSGKIPFWQQVASYLARKADDYDAVWLHAPLMLSTRKLSNAKKLMVTVHSTYAGFSNACRKCGISRLIPYYNSASKIESHFFKQLSNIQDGIVTTVSPSVAEEIHQQGFTRVPYVVSNGLEINNLKRLSRHEARSLIWSEFPLSFSKSDMILLYSGRITEVKQPLLLVSLLKAIGSTRQNIHLIAVGSGNLLVKLKKKVAQQCTVHFLGQVPHEKMPLLMSAADVFISLSCYEGLPLSVLEAAVLRVPLILSDIPAHKWIVDQKIGDGLLVDSIRPDCKEVLDFLGRVEKGEVVPSSQPLDRFSWTSVAERYLTLMCE
jgi:glycosyltransferase involved in cell wall biosynthesis